MSDILDIAIIGAGPAGLTAGLYAIRTGRRAVLFEKMTPGGQAATTWQVDNYPGLPHINGAELMMKIEQQVRELGLDIQMKSVDKIMPGQPHKLIAGNEEIQAKTVIVATGAKPKLLNVPGEQEYRGRGVSYCATCDGAFFRDKVVAVIGGGNTALEEADFLTRFASKVILIHRREQFRADKIVQDHILENPKIEVMTPYTVDSIEGDQNGVRSIKVNHRGSNACTLVDVQGVFIFVGLTPQTSFCKGCLSLNQDDYIITDHDLSTDKPGLFSAGDCRDNTLKQIIVAAGEGATAAMMADRYIQIQQALQNI